MSMTFRYGTDYKMEEQSEVNSLRSGEKHLKYIVHIKFEDCSLLRCRVVWYKCTNVSERQNGTLVIEAAGRSETSAEFHHTRRRHIAGDTSH